MKEKDIFKEKAKEGYTFCFADKCPLKERCLHYLVGQQMSDDRSTYSCVNPRFQDVGTANCSLFRKAEKVKFAKGMMHIFNDDMPKRVEPCVRTSSTAIAAPIIMSFAMVSASSLLPSKRRYASISARPAGTATSCSMGSSRIMSGKIRRDY